MFASVIGRLGDCLLSQLHTDRANELYTIRTSAPSIAASVRSCGSMRSFSNLPIALADTPDCR